MFKHPNCKEKLIDIAILGAVNKGGTHLDCFDGALPQMYSKHGFVPTAKVAFNDTSSLKIGILNGMAPLIFIFMSYDSDAAKTVGPNQNIRGPLIKQAIADLPYSSSYEDAEKI
ncbi:MAG: hypothetical protein H0T62_09645 [Parachlamydiaceae bacterium]|nr:hypothetical protein [Parachlamydiaceae bacterium]